LRILVIGSGGRESAIIWKLAQSDRVSELLCAPGNAGTAALAETLPIPVTNLDALVVAATQRRVDLVVVGPEDPLALGLADRLRDAGIAVCGNSAAATRIESSKSWANDLMREAGIPTAASVTVRDLAAGRRAIAEFGAPVVIKADGLAAGKGVVVAQSVAEAEAALRAMLEEHAFGDAGATVVIEECLTGRELSVLALSDGTTIVPLQPACDYKRAFANEEGPNTGGMGAYTPTRAVDDALLATIQRTILEPAMQAMNERGCPLRGVLYAGLILTADGPRVIEFNARFGDPETQVVLPVLQSDLAALLHAVATGTRATMPAPVSAGAAVGVILAAAGYPVRYEKDQPITGLDRVSDEILVFHAGTTRDADGGIVTAGGRVLTVVGRGDTLAAARDRAYGGIADITFPGGWYRPDIALREV
jgi:phosphoribosylamine--glycine ligase